MNNVESNRIHQVGIHQVGTWRWTESVMVTALSALLLLATVTPTRAQEAGAVQAETNAVISIAAQKIQGLAGALNEEHYTWSPDEGVRSVAEVVSHIAGTNYWMMTLLGFEVPSDAPVTSDYSSVDTFEQGTDRDAILAHLEKSFEFLNASIAAVPDERLNEPMDIFGTPGTVRSYLGVASAHLHEHLGQLIAYARMNGVAPPWSS